MSHPLGAAYPCYWCAIIDVDAALYNITQGKLASPGNKLGIFEDLNDHYSQQDLNDFFKSAYNKFPQGTHPELRGIDGAIGPVAVQNAGLESSLDFQVSMSPFYLVRQHL